MSSAASQMDDLQARWGDLTSFVSEGVREKWWARIHTNYSQRPFHNLQHLGEMLALFDTYKDKLKDRYAVGFAIFFKHLEYNPQSLDKDDAEKNALCMREFCSETTLDQENYVANLLIESGRNCTDAHMNKDQYGEDDIHFLIDFDTAWLGSSPDNYSTSKDSIRKEYSHLSDNEWKEQRLKILQLFLMMPNIFATREFRERFESSARQNIQREIDELKR